MSPEPLSLHYEGLFHDEVVLSLTSLVERALVEQGRDRETRLRIKALLVEQFQNVQRYSLDLGRGTLEVGMDGGQVFVETRNAIDPAEEAALAATLAELSRSEPEALRQRYLQTLHDPSRTLKPGAGLGFLSLAHLSARPLVYSFEPRPDGGRDFRLRSHARVTP